MKMIFLVDGDNNIGTGLQGIDSSPSRTPCWCSTKRRGWPCPKFRSCAQAPGPACSMWRASGAGKNSIDFQIITELGVLVGKHEADYAYVHQPGQGLCRLH